MAVDEDLPLRQGETMVGLAPKRSGREVDDDTPSAKELKRIVEEAEEFKINPQTARLALRDETGNIPTECRLRWEVATADQVFHPER